jgi:hypothetical protein
MGSGTENTYLLAGKLIALGVPDHAQLSPPRNQKHAPNPDLRRS